MDNGVLIRLTKAEFELLIRCVENNYKIIKMIRDGQIQAPAPIVKQLTGGDSI